MTSTAPDALAQLVERARHLVHSCSHKIEVAADPQDRTQYSVMCYPVEGFAIINMIEPQPMYGWHSLHVVALAEQTIITLYAGASKRLAEILANPMADPTLVGEAIHMVPIISLLDRLESTVTARCA